MEVNISSVKTHHCLSQLTNHISLQCIPVLYALSWTRGGCHSLEKIVSLKKHSSSLHIIWLLVDVPLIVFLFRVTFRDFGKLRQLYLPWTKPHPDSQSGFQPHPWDHLHWRAEQVPVWTAPHEPCRWHRADGLLLSPQRKACLGWNRGWKTGGTLMWPHCPPSACLPSKELE